MFKKQQLALFVMILIALLSLSVSGKEAFARSAMEVSPENNQQAVDVNNVWTLEESVNRTAVMSPRIHAANAERKARLGVLAQSGAWPNPDLELSINDKLGLDDGSGGFDLTQIAISQPIPLGRLSKQRQQAKARLEASNQDYLLQQLLLETETAHRFHLLQLMSSKLEVTEEQFEFAKRYKKDAGQDSQKEDSLVRYLNPLEQKRLDIMRASASQEVANIEGEYSEAVAGFKTLLFLNQGDSHKTAVLEPIDSMELLDILLRLQEEKHPAIIAGQYQEEATDVGISLAKLERLQDPTVTVFGERDHLDNERQNYFGISLNLTLPFWDRKQGLIQQATAESEKAKHEQLALKQELQSRLKQAHLHLAHLIEQVDHYYNELLIPAREVFELTRKSFAVGEVNVLSLVDANNTYFDARRRYLELLYETHIELAELRLSSGISIATSDVADNKGATV